MTHALKIYTFERLDSTNTHAFTLAKEGQKEITVVRAREQTKGVGRRKRTWYSPKNKGLYVSFLFRPRKNIKRIPTLGILMAVACCRALKPFARVRIKWPNDLMLNTRKIGGVLLQMQSSTVTPAFVVVGLGLNITTTKSHLPPGASSLKEETGKTLSADTVFSLILKEVLTLYRNVYKKNKFSLLKRKALKLSDTHNKVVSATTKHGKITGVAFGLDEYGALLVKNKEDGIINIALSDVTRLRVQRGG